VSDRVATGQQKRVILRENVVVLTTVVDLTRQLSNLRFEVQRLVQRLVQHYS